MTPGSCSTCGRGRGGGIRWSPQQGRSMRTVLNVIWVVLGGFWLALGYFLAGILACILIVTIPVGIASFRMAR
ncbi:MAG: hypothetical protein KDB41_13335, partial [Propionibacteriaceae bacterium]|nr:hypothetical protein [Propionibacteriaceae bacterium]